MADETKRVIDQTTDSSLSAGDYVIIDSQSEGTRKFDLGTELTDIKEDLATKTSLSEEAKQALLACFENVAWINDDGQNYYDALESALYPPVNLSYISAVYTQSGMVYDTDSLNSLKPDLVVTAHFSDSSTQTITAYALSGTLAEGTSIITVSYDGKTTTFTVSVTHDTSNLLYSWDLRESLVDSIGNVTAIPEVSYAQKEETSRNSGTAPTRDSNGVHLNAEAQYIEFPGVYKPGRTYEIDIANLDMQEPDVDLNRRLFMIDNIVATAGSYQIGFVFRRNSATDGSANTWCIYNDTNSQGWQINLSQDNWISNPNYFSGKTLKVVVGLDGTWHVYANETHLFDSTVFDQTKINNTNRTGVVIGTFGWYTTPNVLGASAPYNITITGFRVYENEPELVYNWDLTESLVDSISNQEITLLAATGVSNASRDSGGLHFDAATQLAYLGDLNLSNKTVEIDVASFSFAGDTSKHVRFFITANNPPSDSLDAYGNGPLIYRAGNGWSAYGWNDASGVNRAWSSVYDSSLGVDAINGKTVKIIIGSDDRTKDIYLDDTLIGSDYSIFVYNSSNTKSYCYIGGLKNGVSSPSVANGDQCYNMTITGIRIYSNI